MEDYYFKGRDSVAVVQIIQEISAAFPAILAFILSVATRITTGEGALLRINP
jgi:hypothetical protein